MNIYTIGDLHLSKASAKPMEVFGDQWIDHDKKIEESWRRQVQPEDVVVIPGDVSWAIDFTEVIPDLQWLQALPGQKILLKGNHEYWWGTGKKLEELKERENLTTIRFLHNTYIYIEEKQLCLCGTRGWKCPEQENADGFSEQDAKIYRREILRLESSLKQATAHGGSIMVFMHYPPFNARHDSSGFTEILERYQVARCYYGHLHGPAHRLALNGRRPDGSCTEYRLVSADYVNFQPVQIL